MQLLSNLVVTQDGEVVGTYLDTALIANLISIFIPLLVNLITKRSASDGLKTVVNIVAVALNSVVLLWVNPSGTPITWQLCVNVFLTSLIASFVAYKGVWKPTGVSGSIAASTGNFGLGSPPKMETANKGAEDMGQVDNDPRE